MRTFLFLAINFVTSAAWCSVDPQTPVDAPAAKVKYKTGKDLNFDELVIDGQLKRPDLAVVTGDNDENANGLLRLRENFVDHMAETAGQDNQ